MPPVHRKHLVALRHAAGQCRLRLRVLRRLLFAGGCSLHQIASEHVLFEKTILIEMSESEPRGKITALHRCAARGRENELFASAIHRQVSYARLYKHQRMRGRAKRAQTGGIVHRDPSALQCATPIFSFSRSDSARAAYHPVKTRRVCRLGPRHSGHVEQSEPQIWHTTKCLHGKIRTSIGRS